MASLGRDRNGALPYEPAAGPRAREWARPLWLGPALLVLVRARWLRFGTADRHACAINSQHAMLVRIPSVPVRGSPAPPPPFEKTAPALAHVPSAPCSVSAACPCRSRTPARTERRSPYTMPAHPQPSRCGGGRGLGPGAALTRAGPRGGKEGGDGDGGCFGKTRRVKGMTVMRSRRMWRTRKTRTVVAVCRQGR
jgi:hypothetical protein